MSKDTTYFIVALATEEISYKFQEGRKLLNISSKIQADPGRIILLDKPHVTLKSSFFLTEMTEKALIDELRLIVFPSIDLTFQKRNVFDTERYGSVLVMEPNPDSRLNTLHEHIYKIVSGRTQNKNVFHYEGDFYTPHMSFMYNMPEELVHQAETYVDLHILPFTMNVSRYQLMMSSDVIGTREIVAEFHAQPKMFTTGV